MQVCPQFREQFSTPSAERQKDSAPRQLPLAMAEDEEEEEEEG
jgi:hypothetical protein